MGLVYKMVNVTIKTPGQIKTILETEGKAGFEAHGVGSSYLFLGKEDDRPREHQMVSIILRSPAAILDKIQEEAAGGWHLAALGTNFAFFAKATVQAAPPPAYRMEKISLMTPGGILSLANSVGQEGWSLRGMGSAVALFARQEGCGESVHHILEGTLLKTPGRMQSTLESKVGDGYRLACVTRAFLAFSRAAPPAV